MLKAGGYLIFTNHDGLTEEQDTFSCAHCNRIVPVPPMSVQSTFNCFCRKCDKPICPECDAKMAATLTCEPFEKWLDMKERSGRFRALIDEDTARRM